MTPAALPARERRDRQRAPVVSLRTTVRTTVTSVAVVDGVVLARVVVLTMGPEHAIRQSRWQMRTWTTCVQDARERLFQEGKAYGKFQ